MVAEAITGTFEDVRPGVEATSVTVLSHQKLPQTSLARKSQNI